MMIMMIIIIASIKKESELQELLVQTNTAIEKCLEKKKVLRHDISHVEERRRNLCNSLVDKGKKELLKFQQKWKQDERKRLCQLEKQKTATMKKEAAKALEPELRRIVQQYKNELQRKENDINDELETFKGQLKLEIEAKMAKCKRDLDAELRQLIQRTDEEYQQKVDKLKLFHEQQIKETQKEANEEFQSMITHHQEKEELLKAKLQTQQCSITLQINEAKALMQNELKKLQNIIDEEAHDMAEQTKTYVFIFAISANFFTIHNNNAYSPFSVNLNNGKWLRCISLRMKQLKSRGGKFKKHIWIRQKRSRS